MAAPPWWCPAQSLTLHTTKLTARAKKEISSHLERKGLKTPEPSSLLIFVGFQVLSEEGPKQLQDQWKQVDGQLHFRQNSRGRGSWVHHCLLGSRSNRSNWGKPPYMGGPFLSPNLLGPQNTRKWTLRTWNKDVGPPTFTNSRNIPYPFGADLHFQSLRKEILLKRIMLWTLCKGFWYQLIVRCGRGQCHFSYRFFCAGACWSILLCYRNLWSICSCIACLRRVIDLKTLDGI